MSLQRNQIIRERVAANYIEADTKKSINQRCFLLKMTPQDAILCLLDKIFDYLDFDDLEKAACVCKFFCYTATMDKLYTKFDLEGVTSEEDDNFELNSISKDLSKELDRSPERLSLEKHKNNRFGHKSVISAGASTFHRTDTAKLTKDVHSDKEERKKNDQDKLDSIMESVESGDKWNVKSTLGREEYIAGEGDSHTPRKITVNDVDNVPVRNVNSKPSKQGTWSKRVTGGSIINNHSPYTSESLLGTLLDGKLTGFEHSPSIQEGKRSLAIRDDLKSFRNMHERRQTIQDMSEQSKDALLKTVVFTEGMNEAYSDSEHINKCYKSIRTEEVKNPSSQYPSNCSKKNIHEGLAPKRKDSIMVRLKVNNVPPAAQRRFTRANTNDIKKLLPKFRHRPSLFIQYNNQLGSIRESTNESQDKHKSNSCSSSSSSHSSSYISSKRNPPKRPDKRNSVFPTYTKFNRL